MKKTLPFFILVLFTFFSCNPDKIFEKNEKMEDNKWLKSKVITFEVPIEDTSAVYNISLIIRHTEYYPFANILIGINQITPSGEERYKDFDLRLRNPDGTFKGEGAGDIWDTELLVYQKISFNTKGIFKFVVENHMPKVETEGIMEVGLLVEKTKI